MFWSCWAEKEQPQQCWLVLLARLCWQAIQQCRQAIGSGSSVHACVHGTG